MVSLRIYYGTQQGCEPIPITANAFLAKRGFCRWRRCFFGFCLLCDLSLDFCEIYDPLKTIKSRFPFLNNRSKNRAAASGQARWAAVAIATFALRATLCPSNFAAKVRTFALKSKFFRCLCVFFVNILYLCPQDFIRVRLFKT